MGRERRRRTGAAAIAEAGRIEVPSVDSREQVTVAATQASRWTEGSYDVWHLTGGVRISQGGTEATAHEAVVWIEQDPGGSPVAGTGDEQDGPPVRSLLVRMAGDVTVRAADVVVPLGRKPWSVPAAGTTRSAGAS